MNKSTLVLTMFITVITISNFSKAEANHQEIKMEHFGSTNLIQERTAEAEPTAKLFINKIEDRGNKKLVQIKLLRIKDDSPITLNDLKETHTQKIQLLIIDDSLQDYSHIHPSFTQEPGVYEFEWQPRRKANYRIWADIFLLEKNAEEYVIADLITRENKSLIERKFSSQAAIDGFIFKLTFDNKPLQVGKATMGKVTITDNKGNLVKDLEPIMGAFAHIVGLNEDFKTVTHVHPMGEEPVKVTDRGGPSIQFHIVPEKIGLIKLFVQLKIKGKELFVPFTINVH